MAIFSQELKKLKEYKEPEKPPVTLVKDFQQEQQQLELGFSLEQSVGVNPDEHAEALKISDKVGLPPDSVRQDLPNQRDRARQLDIDREVLIKNNPRFSKVLADPDFSKVAADDFDALQSIENVFKSYQEISEGVDIGYAKTRSVLRRGIVDPAIAISAKAPVAFGQSVVGLADLSLGLVDKFMSAFYGIHKEHVFDPLQEMTGGKELPEYTSMFGESESLGRVLNKTIGLDFDETQQTISQLLSPETLGSMKSVEEAEGFFDTITEYATNPAALTQDVLTSWPYLVSAMAAAQKASALGASNAKALLTAHATEGALTAGALNESLQSQGVSVEDARKYSAGAGIMTSVIGFAAGKLGLGDAVESLLIPKPKGILANQALAKGKIKTLTIEAMKGFAQEGVLEEGPQNVSENFFENLAKDKPGFEGVGKAYAQGIAVGGPMGMTMNVISAISNNAIQIQTAQDNQDVMESLGNSAKASKLRERAPEQFKQFIDEATKDGPVENVYIAADKFDEYFQTAGIDVDQVLEELPEVREQIEQARERNGNIVIPINDYAAKLAGTEHHASLMQDVKFNPTELTPREAAEMREKLPEMLNEYIQMEQAKADAIAQDNDVTDRLYEAAQKMQVEAGELPTMSAPRSQLIAETFKTLADRYGLDAIEEFNRRGIEVRGVQPEIEGVDTLIEQIKRGQAPKEEADAVIDYLNQKGIDLATATNKEIKAALQAPTEVVEGVEYDQVKDFTVNIEAIEEETGRTIRISENADIALEEVDNNIKVLQELIECVG